MDRSGMTRSWWFARLGVVLGTGLFGVSVASAVCQHIQSSGCGTGSNWCTVGQEFCETGYSSIRTGCGHNNDNTTTRNRHCYKITSALTVACDPGYDGSEKPTGCAPQSGVCCFAEFQEIAGKDPGGQTIEPSGAKCQCGPAVP